ncbi:hypothetical protein V1511DRAFT_454664, partial [Dipodascopsis uninucleata]
LRRSLKGGAATSSNSADRMPSSSSSSHHSVGDKSPLTILPPKKIIRALYDYDARSEEELSFFKGDFFHVIGNENDSDWYEACNPSTNVRGMVPVSYFEVLGRNERDSADSRSNKNSISKSNSQMSATSDMSSTSSISSSQTRKQYTPLYGVVMYNFAAERPDELEAFEGDAVIIVAQSNHEWFVAKPIGRLGGPGLIPVSFVEIRDMTTGRPVENVEDAVARAGVPRVEEWKKRTAEYKASSIPLGKFEDDSMQQKDAAHGSYISYNSRHTSTRLSQSTSGSVTAYDPAIINATVDKYSFDNGRYWYLLIAEMEDGTYRNLCRFYEDFYDFQIRLLDEFPEEAGRTGRQRILPFIPGPVTYVNDSISSQRRANLDEYVRKLVALPPYISRSALVKSLFVLRDGDVETSQPGSATPTPIFMRDSRLGQQTMINSIIASPIITSPTSTSATAASNTNISTNTGVTYGGPGSGNNSTTNSVRQMISHNSISGASSGATRMSNLSDSSHATFLTRNNSNSSSTTTSAGDLRGSVSNSRDIEYERHAAVGASKQSQSNATGASSAFSNIKVKVFYNDDLVAVRVPSDITYSKLENKLQERLGSTNLKFYYQDDNMNQRLELNNDKDLESAISAQGSKLLLYAQ